MLVLTTVTTNAQKTVKSYQSAYLINRESAVRIAKEQQLNKKTVAVQVFLIEYPVLDSIKNYNPREKYSLINSDLISAVVTSDDNRGITFFLKNGEVYRVKKKRQVNTYFAPEQK
jgi:hypothetical protein